MEKINLATAGLIVVKENKLLLAFSKNKKAWYLPGGKIEKGENSQESLQREIFEELNIKLNLQKLSYYCHISAPAYGESPNVIMQQDCFLYELYENINPNNEIERVCFFDYQMYKKEEVQVKGVLKVFEKLAKDEKIKL